MLNYTTYRLIDLYEHPELHQDFLSTPGYLIYKITNLFNSKCYIGDTDVHIGARLFGHFKNLDSNKKHHLYNAIHHYGLDNFTIEILSTERGEAEWIAFYDSCDNGYNANYSGTFGKRLSFEDRSLMNSKGNYTKLKRGTHIFQIMSEKAMSTKNAKACKTLVSLGKHNFQNRTKASKSLASSKQKVNYGDTIIAYLESNRIQINEHNFNANRHKAKGSLFVVPKYQSYLKHLAIVAKLEQA
jgi:group I intron endonuclease